MFAGVVLGITLVLFLIYQLLLRSGLNELRSLAG
jgi:hypothetical protein